MSVDVEKVIREYLPDVIHMSLGTSKDNRPWVCEVHFAYDDDLNLYFSSLTSRRHSQEIAANPYVAGNIVRQFQKGEEPRGVYFEGRAKLLEPGDEQAEASKHYGSRFDLGDEMLEEAKRPDGNQFYKITVTNWYIFGEFEAGKGRRKYSLAWKDQT